jgi:hypothetical protein
LEESTLEENSILRYLAIDFSLNSPAACFFDGKDCQWFSLTRTSDPVEKFTKKITSPYSVLGSLEDKIHLLFLEKRSTPDDYTQRERHKMVQFDDIVSSFWGMFSHLIDDQTIVSMEGLSFSSSGNSLIDISMATALLRKRILDQVGFDRFFVYSPGTIKKFALKGNSKKNELYIKLIESKKSTEIETLRLQLDIYKDQWITKGGSVHKPIDDLVDSTWIYLLTRSNFEEK